MPGRAHASVQVPGHPDGRGHPHQEAPGPAPGPPGVETAVLHPPAAGGSGGSGPPLCADAQKHSSH